MKNGVREDDEEKQKVNAPREQFQSRLRRDQEGNRLK